MFSVNKMVSLTCYFIYFLYSLYVHTDPKSALEPQSSVCIHLSIAYNTGVMTCTVL